MAEKMALTATWLVLGLSLACVALAADPYCDGAYLYYPDGTRIAGTGDWSSVGKNAAFHAGPCTGVSGISMTQTHLKTVLIIDRSASTDGHVMLAGTDLPAYAQEMDIQSGTLRNLNVITNTFCSSAQYFADGTLINVGGDNAPDTDYVKPGGFSIRSFKPCLPGGNCIFKVIGETSKYRWYPTTQLLPDGRMIIIGGATGALGINTPDTNVPFIEYFPKKAAGEAFELPFLTETMPYNLFPFCHLLPSGLLFIFSGNKYILFNTLTNAEVPGKRPALAVKDYKGNMIYRQYPLSATSAMFPLSPAKKYLAEIMICGGTTDKAQSPEADDPMYPADDKCWRIAPEAARPAWTMEKMKLRRVMPMAILLPDGQVMIHGGAMRGHTGFWNMAHNASLVPELYDTNTYKWSTVPMPASKVPRGYHASAHLLHDGSVIISGSNTADGTVQGPIDFPTEFRVEYFHPPYMMGGKVRPVLVTAPKATPVKAPLAIVFKYAGAVKSIKVVLVHPGFATHGANHGMRSVELQVLGSKAVGAVHTVNVAGCPNKNICPATFYWLFVVVNGIPNGDGHYIFVR